MRKSDMPATLVAETRKSSVRPSKAVIEDLYTPEINYQTRIRIQVAKAAYAYEIEDNPIISDAAFDRLAKEVDLSVDTRRPDLDKFFRDNFTVYTGAWIWKHPDFDKIGWLVNDHREKVGKPLNV